MTASTDAAEAVAAAMAAVANLATMQTGATAGGLAEEASTAAGKAMMAYMHAKAASEAAAAAEDVTAAVEARVMAETAMASAVTYGMMATEKAGEAETAAMAELMIDGTMKSVGEMSINAEASRSEVTSGSGAKTITGQSDTLIATGTTTDGREEVDASPEEVPPIKYVSPMVNAAMRDDLKIGKQVDSADDMARLQIITAYASTQSVRVYDAASDTGHRSNKEGQIVVSPTGELIAAADGNFDAEGNLELSLTPVGMFYAASGGTEIGTIEPMGLDTDDAQQGDTVMSKTKAKQVYSFVNTGLADDLTVYVVLNETIATTDSAGKTTKVYEYVIVDIHHPVNQDGLGTDGTPITGDEMVFVTASLPVAKSYSHIHFGVWAGLGEAAKDGAQKVTDLGIGFVQSIGDGMTGADMPSTGGAMYNGNWVATVQAAAGGLALKNGDATLAADFNKATVKATLTDLATLEGSIDGSMFSGTKATVGANAHGLTSDGKFSGSFDGGFYGTKAAEAGAIFDFESTDAGAFRGAFGGAKEQP